MAAPPVHPNTITAARMPLAPLAVAALLMGTTTGVVIAAVLSLILEITDLADGWIARRYQVVSDFGKLFDPFSDAFSRFTLFLGLFALGHANIWMILVIFFRDSFISFIRTVSATRDVVLAARPSGKIKAVVQGVGTQVCYIALVLRDMIPDQAAFWGAVPWWTMLFITFATFLSLLDYVAGSWSVLRSAWNDDKVATRAAGRDA
jgi:CDP-diacylglycerol--glycerol-3-phosphate 3-phosphatidyltransferase